MASVLERVQRVAAERLGVDESKVVPEASFVDDLNADSLDLEELLMALEEEFTEEGTPVEISDEAAEKIQNVQAAVDFIQAKGIKDS